jgi:hypothetical protein
MYYGMFTDEGNRVVHEIVQNALQSATPWSEVYRELVGLAKLKNFSEATDTAVREEVYNAIRAYERGEEFFV